MRPVAGTGCSSPRPSSATTWCSIAAQLDKLGERLLDPNRTIGQPNKITTIFGRKVTKLHHGKLQTEIERMDLANPVIRSHYRNGFIKQYVRDHLILRTEASTNNVTNYGVRKKPLITCPLCAPPYRRSTTTARIWRPGPKSIDRRGRRS